MRAKLRRSAALALWVSASALACLSALAGAGPQTEIQVKLFGQPCTLSGPTTEDVLNAIHSISPEQVSPIIESEELGPVGPPTIENSIRKLRETKSVPPQLDRYRERLLRRLEAYVDFIRAVQSKRANKTDGAAFLKAVRKHLRKASRQAKAFESETRKITNAVLTDEAALKIFATYGEAIEPDPEEEFHRAIRRMKIRYGCAFDESAPPAGSTEGAKPE